MAKPDTAFDLCLVGCGRMGSALLKGWLDAGIVDRALVLEPAGLPSEFAEYSPNPVIHFADAGKLAAFRPRASIYVMAVKPQIMDEVCRAIAPVLSPDALILSIAAGQTIAAFEKRFGAGQPVVRAMPNTPAAIGKGMTAACANAHVGTAMKSAADQLLRAVGKVAWIDDEAQMDAVTAVAGSGPAYIFYLIECMARAGIAAGLDEQAAMTLARETVIGSAALAAATPHIPAATLRENVTSPGGTTAAALEILMDGSWQDTLTRAILKATERGRALSK